MSTIQTAFRLPDELLERIDRYAVHLTMKHGFACTRADAVRLLLAAGLTALEPTPTPKKKAKKR